MKLETQSTRQDARVPEVPHVGEIARSPACRALVLEQQEVRGKRG